MVNKILPFVWSSVLSPLLDLLVKKACFFFLLGSLGRKSDANCPDESVLEQSKQNRAPSLKCHQEAAEHMPFRACFPPLLLLLLPSVCRGIAALRGRGRSMPFLCQLKQSDRALYTNLRYIYSVMYNTNRLSAGRQTCAPLYLFFHLCLATAFGSYCLIQGSK